MTALAGDLDLDQRHRSEYRSLAHPDIALVKVWHIMVAVHLIDAFEAALFDHGQRTSRTLLGWLEKQSDHFVRWDLVSVGAVDLREGHQGSHVAVVTAHVSVIRLRLVVEIWIVFWDWKSVHVGTEGDAVDSAVLAILRHLAFSSQVHDHASAGAWLDLALGDADFEEHVVEGGLRLEFLEPSLSMLVDLSPKADHVLGLQPVPLHYFSVLGVIWLEIRLGRSRLLCHGDAIL